MPLSWGPVRSCHRWKSSDKEEGDDLGKAAKTDLGRAADGPGEGPYCGPGEDLTTVLGKATKVVGGRATTDLGRAARMAGTFAVLQRLRVKERVCATQDAVIRAGPQVLHPGARVRFLWLQRHEFVPQGKPRCAAPGLKSGGAERGLCAFRSSRGGLQGARRICWHHPTSSPARFLLHSCAPTTRR